MTIVHISMRNVAFGFKDSVMNFKYLYRCTGFSNLYIL